MSDASNKISDLREELKGVAPLDSKYDMSPTPPPKDAFEDSASPGSGVRKLVQSLSPNRHHVQTHEEQLGILANKINAADGRAKSLTDAAAIAWLEAGRLLCKAKEMVPHGQWLNWLTGNTPQSERTAQLYMQFARKVDGIGGEEQAKRVADLSFRSAMTMLGLDPTRAPTCASEAEAREMPPHAKVLKDAFKRIKVTIRPILDGETIDLTTNKEVIRALRELIVLLSPRNTATSTVTPDAKEDTSTSEETSL